MAFNGKISSQMGKNAAPKHVKHLYRRSTRPKKIELRIYGPLPIMPVVLTRRSQINVRNAPGIERAVKAAVDLIEEILRTAVKYDVYLTGL